MCDAQQSIWQVEFAEAPGDDAVFFVVERKDQWTFVMKSVSDEALDDCKDVEIPKTQRTMFAKPLVWD